MKTAPTGQKIATVIMGSCISAQGLLVSANPDGTAKIKVDDNIYTGALVSKNQNQHVLS
jgi:hypothetical protein